MSRRIRIHVGWRVVRMRDGVREWWTFDLPDWDVRPDRAHTWSTRTMPGARAIAKRFGGRVVKVFLSYRKGG